eukprot:m.232044 g.232044  ORF g.232044 m.232044 type:complete len:1131 (-) comp33613_c0_seq8:3838-7230(-)
MSAANRLAVSSNSRGAKSPVTTRKKAPGKTTTARLKTSFPESRGSPARSPVPRGGEERGTGRNKVSKHVDAKVAARNNALNAMGGVKVDVFVRVRPVNSKEDPASVNVSVVEDSNQLTVTDSADRPTVYEFDKVYGPDVSQAAIYEDAVAPIVDQVSRGLSCAVFAYGQTGSGKTHTMRGSSMTTDESDHGIIQRSLENLFRRLHEQDYTGVNVSVSFLEIYNEDLEDMLKPSAKSKLMLVDHEQRGCVCANLTENQVDNVKQVLTMLNTADKNTKVSETKMNKYSNRAHRIFTIIAKFKRYETDVVSTLTFIDLAGSEDINKSGATGLTAREAAHINKSLLTLGRVINALACNEKHIPYRDSKLTRLLSEALGGVCKTSFIACVSPCASSSTETTSTLRYAERAMEALNISQLPRWKQDEIMIDGLTRRVQALVSDLAQQDKIHKEEMNEVKNANIALEEEKKTLQIQNYRLNRKIEKLLIRKGQLKSGLAVTTSQRDMLHSQKEHLREELLYTRKERDGYLNDRVELTLVLQTVRIMRDRLLKAQVATEESLTEDAVLLKGVVEGAIVDIGDLHTEIERKKAMSSHNENVADEYKDRMSGKVRSIVQIVDDFKLTQDKSHSKITDDVAALRNQNQIDSNNNKQSLSALSTKTAELLANISAFCSDTESALNTKIHGQEISVQKFGSNLTTVVNKLKAATTTHLEELRSEASTCESKVADWADKVASKLTEQEHSTSAFADMLAASITSLQTSIDSASAAHIDHLATHKNTINDHLATEKKVIANESKALIDNIQGYVNRLISDFSNKTIRRTDTALTSLSADTDLLDTESKSMLEDQKAQQKALSGKGADWSTTATKSLQEGQATNATMKSAADSRIAAIVNKSQVAEGDVKASVESTVVMSDTHVKACNAAFNDEIALLKKRTDETSARTASATDQHAAATEVIKGTISTQGAGLGKACDGLKNELSSTLADVTKHTETVNDDLFDHEADGVNYVNKEIERDVKAAVAKKGYTFPDEFQATDPYPTILSDLPQDWGRESDIVEGKLEPGKVTDFPGTLAEDDDTGIITTTADKPVPADKAAILESSGYHSSPEDYESTELPPVETVADDEEDEEEVEEEAVVTTVGM